jgi:predicted acylesterase/phospholipase RssA
VSARRRIALCLCGGGVTGGMYEIGALAALDELLRAAGRGVGDLDIYVGTSAGSFVATLMAGGLPIDVAYRAVVEDDQKIMPARRSDIYRFDFRQGLGLARDLVGVLAKAALDRPRPAELVGRLLETLPAGIFSLRHYERFLDRFLRHHGLPTRFPDLRRELYITANDLDSGHRAVFGRGALAEAPLALAICASSAIPLFFEPVRYEGRDYVDGAVGKVDHADLALERGAEVVIVVNPLVPFRHQPGAGLPSALIGARHMRDKGMLAVYSQAAKMSTHTKLYQGLRRYRAAHPNTKLLLIEPSEEEAELFLENPMSFESRRRMAEYGRSSTSALLHRERDRWLQALQAQSPQDTR